MFDQKDKRKSFDPAQDKPEIKVAQSIEKSFSEPDWLDNDQEGQLLLDVFQDNKNIYVKSTIAGVKPEDLDIAINNDMLTIRGSRSQEEIVDQGDYFCQECYWGSFSRSIILPTEVKSDKISATLKNGVLMVILPKAKKKKNIEVKIK